MPYDNETLCVPRGYPPNLSEGIVAQSKIDDIPSGYVLVKVHKFGWSANNVTYGMLGEDPHFRYFDFHPAPDAKGISAKTHGVIPVWAFGTIEESYATGLIAGERVFGYFPSAKYMLVQVDEADINRHNFYALRPHLPSDRRPYNQITRCAADPLYNSDMEDATMLYRPLFWTSFWAEDWLTSKRARASDAIIISSASSKTGFCLALVAKKRSPRRRIVGLTSKRNMGFVKSLGLYDEVLEYDALKSIGLEQGPYVYADVAGNDDLNERVIAHLGKALAFGFVLGMSHGSPDSKPKKNTHGMDMFFMPEWMHEVRKRTTVQEIAQRQKQAWEWLMVDGKEWIDFRSYQGSSAVLGKFKETLSGSVRPDEGLVFSLWNAGTAKARL